MKRNERPKNWVMFTNYAFVDRLVLPTEVSILDHLVPIEGADPSPRGVYGAPAREAALFAAGQAAQLQGQRLLILRAWFELSTVSAADSLIERLDTDSIDDASIIDLRRVKSALRDALFITMRKMLSPADRAKAGTDSAKGLYSLCVNHPHLIFPLFDLYPKLEAVIHPVRVDYGVAAFKNQPPLPVLTMRDSKGFRMAEVQHHEERIVAHL